jgi:hypothetical protein
MQYQAVLVDDDELPEGIDRVMVERPGKCPLYLIAKSVAPRVFLWTESHWTKKAS